MPLPSLPVPAPRADILLVEDSAKDVRLIREVLSEQGGEHQLHVARDGSQALRMLLGEPEGEPPLRPDLVFMDVNLPKLNGPEVLSRIKENPALKSLPVLMLSTSRAERDVADCYARHANGYLVKPSSYDDFAELMACTLRYWLGLSRLPPKAVPP